MTQNPEKPNQESLLQPGNKGIIDDLLEFMGEMRPNWLERRKKKEAAREAARAQKDKKTPPPTEG